MQKICIATPIEPLSTTLSSFPITFLWVFTLPYTFCRSTSQNFERKIFKRIFWWWDLKATQTGNLKIKSPLLYNFFCRCKPQHHLVFKRKEFLKWHFAFQLFFREIASFNLSKSLNVVLEIPHQSPESKIDPRTCCLLLHIHSLSMRAAPIRDTHPGNDFALKVI